MQLPAPDCSTEQLQVAVATSFSSNSVDWLNHTEPGTRLWVTVKELVGKDAKGKGTWRGQERLLSSNFLGLSQCSFGFYEPSLPTYA